MNTPKAHDNTVTQSVLDGYYSAAEVCEDHARIDDIFSGVLALKTGGNTATRSLSRQTLFHILQCCQTIDVISINKATHGRYAYSSIAGYAATARVASKAIERFIGRFPEEARKLTVAYERNLIDARYGSPAFVACSNL